MKIVNENIVLFDQKLWIKEETQNELFEIMFAHIESFDVDGEDNLLIKCYDDNFSRMFQIPSDNKKGKRILGEIEYSFEIWKRLTETVRAIYDCPDICCPIVVTNYKTKKITISI